MPSTNEDPQIARAKRSNLGCSYARKRVTCGRGAMVDVRHPHVETALPPNLKETPIDDKHQAEPDQYGVEAICAACCRSRGGHLGELTR